MFALLDTEAREAPESRDPKGEPGDWGGPSWGSQGGAGDGPGQVRDDSEWVDAA